MPSNSAPAPVRSRLLLVFAALLFSTGGVAIKAGALTGWQVACFRSAVAAVVLLAALPEARRGWRWRMAPVAVAYAATLIAFVLANRMTTAADTIFLQSTAPLYLLVLGPLLLSEPVRRADLLYMAPVAAGMVLFFVGTEPAVRTAPDPVHGNLVAAFSGLAYAFTLAGLRWLGRGQEGAGEGIATVAAGNLLAAVVTLPMALPVSHVSGADAGVMLYLGVVQIGLAYVCVTRAMRDVPALEANLFLLVEPVFNPVWVWLVHGERPGPWALAGGALILAATVANTLRKRV